MYREFEPLSCHIRIVDREPTARIDGPLSHEFLQGNLCDATVCQRAVKGVDAVLHFAANMGGMGTIHEGNDFTLYEENHRMTTNLLKASIHAGVKMFFFASSACVYPESLQGDTCDDIALAEADLWRKDISPQGLYGLEKLDSELLLQQFKEQLQIRIARFHNVYGPGGVWFGGREKAPAAFLRKALALKSVNDPELSFEIWGSGKQRRSFLYIDDAVDGVMALLKSNCCEPLNIGSDRAVSILQLAKVAIRVADLNLETVQFSMDETKPVGVGSRNSDNRKVKEMIGWKPQIELEDGMELTGRWIADEMKKNEMDPRQFIHSMTLHLDKEVKTFAIILPITSRGGPSPDACLENLKTFARSLVETTWRDTNTLGDTRFEIRVYLIVDEDDVFLHENEPQTVLYSEGVMNIKTLRSTHPPGYVCWLWRDGARQAWNDGCDYFVLLGDDVVLEDEGWMRKSHLEFARVAKAENVPVGFGCIAFTDTSFLGMPTFPIVSRTHMDIFKGEVVPDTFINQDGDPFIFQLYRRWGCSVMFDKRLRNGIGGSGQARYEKTHARDWTFEALDEAVAKAEKWLTEEKGCKTEKKLTLDVLIPSYRVQIPLLDSMLQLEPTKTCSVMKIIIIDNPKSPYIPALEAKYAHRPDIRIRVNHANVGASASRNRGMEESAADWVYFLDDDVVPSPNLLEEAEKVIRNHPNAAGFVGTTFFPPATSIFTAAIHLSGMTYFWDIAKDKLSEEGKRDVPWGVTANLITRRVKDGIDFDLSFPKTGGGEDIDFCRRKRTYFLKNGKEAFRVAENCIATHPWWMEGNRSYQRFHMWAFGDGGLIAKFPENCYWDYAPNSAELMAVCLIGILLGVVTARTGVIYGAVKAFIAVLIANVIHDGYRHIIQHPERYANMNTTLTGIQWTLAVVESSLIRMWSELGRLRGVLGRREYGSIGRRFDWFTGVAGDGPKSEERWNSVQRLSLVIALLGLFLGLVAK
jgi:nucleoside-diphosphate-sugar epimerase/glycosyltransferase involved in cell wall biosynthesis